MANPIVGKAYCSLVDRDVETSRNSITMGNGHIIKEIGCRNVSDLKENHNSATKLNCPYRGKPGCHLN